MKSLFVCPASGLRYVAVLCLGLLCSCATPNGGQTYLWIKDNQNIGTVRHRLFAWGYYYDYLNFQGQTARMERRDVNGQLFPGACTLVFELDAAERVMITRCLDSSEQPCMNETGWSVSRHVYVQDADSNWIEETSFFDDKGKPTTISLGYAETRCTRNPGGKETKIQFLNLSHMPAATTWENVTNAAEVQYSYLQGVNEVTCEAVLDASGKVLVRRMLSGETSESTSDTTYDDYDFRTGANKSHQTFNRGTGIPK